MSKRLPKKQGNRTAATSAKRFKDSWDKGRSPAPCIRVRPMRMLIVTEGTKTEPLYFAVFRDRINCAISNAKRLERVNARLSPANCNPGTAIHQLIADLLPCTRSEDDVIHHE